MKVGSAILSLNNLRSWGFFSSSELRIYHPFTHPSIHPPIHSFQPSDVHPWWHQGIPGSSRTSREQLSDATLPMKRGFWLVMVAIGTEKLETVRNQQETVSWMLLFTIIILLILVLMPDVIISNTFSEVMWRLRLVFCNKNIDCKFYFVKFCRMLEIIFRVRVPTSPSK